MSGETGLVYRCEAGTTYILCHQTMSRMETWVKDSQKFIPERWMNDNKQVNMLNKCEICIAIALHFRPFTHL